MKKNKYLKLFFLVLMININFSFSQNINNIYNITASSLFKSENLNLASSNFPNINKIRNTYEYKNNEKEKNKKNIFSNETKNENITLSDLERKYDFYIRKIFNYNGTPIKQYGYDIFNNYSGSFISFIDNTNYVVGPGDILDIYIWNIPENIYPSHLVIEVKKDGKIFLPKIGIVYVSGKKLIDVKKILKHKLQKYIKHVKLDVSIREPRKISIIISGEVQKPGTYTLTSLNTLWDALNIAGGIKKTGSLRKIYLIRKINGKTKKYIFDLYCLLGLKNTSCLTNLNPEEFYLKTGDIIFIPSIYNTFAVLGESKRKAIFEYIGDISLKYAINNYAGGISPFANKYNVAILRQQQNGSYTALRIFKDVTKIPRSFKIKNGDIIYIYQNKIPAKNIIFVKGEISSPGIYSLIEIKDLYSLLLKLKFSPKTNLNFAILKRNKENGDILISFSPKRVLEGKFNLILKPYDEIIFLNKFFKPPILVSGNALKQSKIVRYYNGISLKDVLNSKDIKYKDINNIRIVLQTENQTNIVLYKDIFLSLNQTNFYLEPGEKVYVVYNPHLSYKKVILYGAVKKPGIYKIDNTTTLYDVLKEAGGFTDNSFPEGIIILRKSIAETQKRYLDITLLKLKLYLQNFAIENLASNQNAAKTNILTIINTQMALIDEIKNKEVLGRILGLNIPFDLEKLKNSPYNIKLEDGDKIYIPIKPNTVFIFGAVRKSGAFYIKHKERLENIIKKAGGYLDSARKDAIYIIKPNGTVISQANLPWYENINDVYVYPGDAIVVPYKLEIKTPILTLIKDVTQILYQSAYTFYLLK